MAWTAEERRAYYRKQAMKKKAQAAAARRAPSSAGHQRRLQPLDGYEVHPHNHACGPGDFEEVANGWNCRRCGRRLRWEVGGYVDGEWRTSPNHRTKRLRHYPLTPRMPRTSNS